MNNDVILDRRTTIQSYLKVAFFFVLFWCVGAYVNLPVRNFLKAQFQSVPYWMDHIFFMILAKTTLAIFLGHFFLKKDEAFLCWPNQRKFVFEGVISGLLIVVLIGVCLKMDGFLIFQLKLNPLVMFGNLFSNFYEELIYRGVLLGLLLKFLGKQTALAIILSSIIFVQGHLHYPFFLVSAVFLSGVYWCHLAIRSKSLLPVWISHCIMDFIADTIFVS